MTQDRGIAGDTAASPRSYAIGFAASVVLTAIAFGLVLSGLLPKGATLLGILAAAVLQILVHLRYFLHLGTSPSQRWSLMTLLFTALIMAIFIGGSLWIMVNLHYRMMG